MTEFTFRPAIIRLKRGERARLQFVNRGQIAHQFESDFLRKVPVQITDEHSYMEAPGLDILRLAPGASARLEFVPLSGTRARFNCTIEGHREAGMSGVIEIR